MSRIMEEDMAAMNFSTNQTTLTAVLKQRDFALMVCLGLVLTNILLVLKVVNAEEHWVLIPHYDVDHRLEMTASKYSDDYFADWANGVVNTIFTVNPDSIDWKIQQILKITIQNVGTLKEKLQAESKKIKADEISTVFYPKKFLVNQSTQTIDVVGQHIAYFGRDSSPVATEKKFRLSWVVRTHGVILLKDFVEVKDE
jgi:type IV conjugative transfer system protein TraE